MPDHAAIARLAAALDLPAYEVEAMIASEAADLARVKRAAGDAMEAEAYDRIACTQWAEARSDRARAGR